jgi:hypothetical protein
MLTDLTSFWFHAAMCREVIEWKKNDSRPPRTIRGRRGELGTHRRPAELGVVLERWG